MGEDPQVAVGMATSHEFYTGPNVPGYTNSNTSYVLVFMSTTSS